MTIEPQSEDSVEGLFSCDVPLEDVHNLRLPLFAGQVNHWLVMTRTRPGESQAETSKRVRFDVEQLLMLHKGDPKPGGGLLESKFPVHPKRIRRLKIGPEATVGPASFLTESRPTVENLEARLTFPKLYGPTIFTNVSFVYTPEGDEQDTTWVWKRANNLFLDCAEGGYGVAAVFAPTPLSADELAIVKEEEAPGLLGELSGLGDKLSVATKVLIGGGVAILLFQLYRATRSEK